MDQLQHRNIAQQLSNWYRVKQRQVLLEQIQAVSRSWLDACFGYYAAEISLLDQSMNRFHPENIPVKFRFGTVHSSAVIDFENLPVDSESLDFIVVCHVLEFVDNPYSLLREIDRALIPEGKLLIISFNPYGWQGISRFFRSRVTAPWCGHFYSLHRIQDWLSVLGFDVVAAGYALIPSKSGDHWPRLSWKYIGHLPLLYSISALYSSKRVSSLKPLGRRWRPPFLKKSVVQPTTLDTSNV